MNGPKIVTGIVFLSLASIGCRAKFTSKGPQNSGPAPTSVAGPVVPSQPTATRPVNPIVNTPTDQPALPPISDERPPQLGCPTSQDGSLDPRRAIQRKTIVFKSGRQMVWRKNCEGVVYSKQWEDLGLSTSQLVRLRPQSNATGMMIFNRTTCDTPSLRAQQVTGRNGEFRFAVSISPSSNAMLVKRGQNLIDYEIPGGEKGTLVLTVKIDNRSEDCVVINDRGCPPRRGSEGNWTDNIFTNN